MRYIKKQEIPQAFSGWKHNNPDANYDKLKKTKTIKRLVKQSLLIEQGNICCYCQKRITLDNSHIEHFKPQDKNYYPELALDYGNLLASCQKEPTKEEPQSCGHKKKNWYDERLIVSPFLLDCADYFCYTEAGDVSPSQALDKNEAANATIINLGLKDSKLKRARKKAIEGLFEDQQLDREDIEKLVANLDRKNEQGEYDEFCSVLIYILKQYL
ncbi:MAG: retron system putative HNH endonuclease [Microcystaceae cyanobacterium]